MMAEILGKKTGYCQGKGGSMHIMDMSLGILGANGIVGGGIPIATGAGYSCKYRGTDQVVLCFFGDGASNEGTFHESINMAAAWDLPVVYIIENNHYGITVDIQPEHEMEKVLFATDELTGLIGAAALMRPSKSVQDMELKSLKKKFKDKRFAAGCSRDVITQGAEMLGWELPELFDRTIAAMQSFAPDRDTFQA